MSESGSEHPQRAKPSRSHLLLAATVVVVLGIVLIFVLSKQDETKQNNVKYAQDVVEQQPQYAEQINTAQTKPTAAEPLEAPETVEIPASANRNEIPVEVAPATPSEPELPSLDNSDEVVKQTVAEIMTEKALALIVNDDMVRRGVVFVENLAKGKIAEKHMPVKKPEEPFMALEDDIVVTDPNSFERYTPYVDMLSSMSTAQIVRMLNKFQPLIAQAYEEIGYNGNDFNGTLDKAISELLSTPIPKSNVPLIKDSVTYRYEYLHGFFAGDDQEPMSENIDRLEYLHAMALPESAFAVDKSIETLMLDKQKVAITALRRNGQELAAPQQSMVLQANDVLLLKGKPRRVERAEQYLLNG